MTTGSPMYFVHGGGTEREGGLLLFTGGHCISFLLLLIMTVPACDYVVNFSDKIIIGQIIGKAFNK